MSGKAEIYAKVVYDRLTGSNTWGFQKRADGILLNIPIWIEIQNLSNSTRILRDINLLLVSGGKEIATMVQGTKVDQENRGVYFYANGGSYSLSVAGGEIKSTATSCSSPAPMFPILMKSSYGIFDERTDPASFRGKVEGGVSALKGGFLATRIG